MFIIQGHKRQQEVIDASNAIYGYQIANKDDDASPNYYGFTNSKGEWYILQETISAGNDTYRYAKGLNNFSTNWTNRVSLSYDYFNIVFAQ